MADIKQQTYTTHNSFNLSTVSQLGYGRNGYDFIKWRDQINGDEFADGAEVTFGKENVYLSAIWNPVVYSITYRNDGTYPEGVSNPASYTIETPTITLNNPSKEFHTFQNWNDGSGIVTQIPKGSYGDREISAVYEEFAKTLVRIFGDGGTVTVRNVTQGGDVTDGQNVYETVVLSIDFKANENYIFDSLKVNGVDIVNDSTYTLTDVPETVISGLAILKDIKYVIFTSKNGTECRFLSDDTTQTIQYCSSSSPYNVIEPYSLCSEISAKTYLVSVEDQTNQITGVGTYAFYYCTGLTSVSLPSVSSIGDSAFHYCTGLTSVSLPSATSIGDSAFYSCLNLSSIYVNNSTLHSIGNGYEEGNWLVVDDSETSVVVAAPAITHVSNDKATSIGSYAFHYCTGLTSVSLPSVSSIGSYAFYSCTGLTSVSLPSATSIGSYAFQFCDGLTSVSLPSVSSIGSYAFYSCTGLTSVSLPSVKSIGSYAFHSCTGLTSVSLPSATSIGDSAFYSCTGLTSVSLPSVKSIGSYAFHYCAGLTSVSLPSVSSIGDSAFHYCLNLSSVSFEGRTNTTPPTVQTDSFDSCANPVTCYVPEDMYDTWIAYDNWPTLISNGKVVIEKITEKTTWDRIVTALENASESDFDKDTLEYKGSNDILNSIPVSGLVDMSYTISSDGSTPVTTKWINLGFNGSIPEYVKYKDASGNLVYVCSMKNGLLSAIAVNDPIYTKSFDETNLSNVYTPNGETVTALGTETFEYGNNCTYSVPKTITTSKGTYTFCGYNVTLQSYTLLNDTTPCADNYYNRLYFDKTGSSNRYGASKIRSFLNEKNGSADAYYDDNNGNSGYYTIGSLVLKLQTNEGLLRNITNTVNRTWVHGDLTANVTLDTNQCEHVVDRFWMLGNGNLNCTGKSGDNEYLKDFAYDTSKFSTVFGSQVNLYSSSDSRKRYLMKTDGSAASVADYWWLRSAYSDNSYVVGSVGGSGIVGVNYAERYGGVSPACLIG